MLDLNHLLKSKMPKVGKILFIAIDGRAGSGKSTLAKLFSEKFNAEIIHTDDFASWDNPINWYPLLIEKIFKPIADGAQVLNYDRSKWWENHYPTPVVNQPVTDVMILEGVTSLRSEFRDYISLSIFVDTPKEICLKRGLERDLATGKTEAEVLALWTDWVKQEDNYLDKDNPKQYADFVVDGTKPLASQLEF